ncbi:hypothetical protein D3C80_1797230 [compost metagenome]
MAIYIGQDDVILLTRNQANIAQVYGYFGTIIILHILYCIFERPFVYIDRIHRGCSQHFGQDGEDTCSGTIIQHLLTVQVQGLHMQHH